MCKPELLVRIKHQGRVAFLATFNEPIASIKDVFVNDCALQVLLADPSWAYGASEFPVKESRRLTIDLTEGLASMENFGEHSIPLCKLDQFYLAFESNFGAIEKVLH